MPPVFDFAASENVKSVTVLWPAPQRFPDGSGGNAIGYAGHVVLPLQVVPQTAGKPVKLRLKLAYGVCEKLCVPVEARGELALTGRAGGHDAALAAAEARVPKPATLGDDGNFAIRAFRQEPASSPGPSRPRVIVDVAAPDAANVDLFAEGPTADWALPLPEPILATPGVRRFAFELDGLPAGAKAAGAALKLTAVAGEEAIEVSIARTRVRVSPRTNPGTTNERTQAMAIKVGDTLPNATFTVMTPEGPKPMSSDEIFKGKKVVLFAVPGAFTPTCHKNHMPGFVKNAAAIKAKGIDAIAVTGVNDVFVMDAWKSASAADGKIDYFLADGSADFAKAVGLTADLNARGLGTRSQRYCHGGRQRRREDPQCRGRAGQGRNVRRR